MRRLLPIAAVLFVVAAVGSRWVLGRIGPPAPLPADLNATDPEVAELVRGVASEVEARRGDADRRMKLGLVYEANSFFDQAVQCYEQVLERDPRRGVAWYRLALCRERVGDFEGAIGAMERAIEREGDYAPAHALLALWRIDAGELEPAAAAVERATALDPHGKGPWVARARLALEQDAPREALAIVEEHELARGSTALFAAHMQATAWRMLGDPEAARRALDAVGGLPVSGGPGIEDPWSRDLASLRTGLAARQRQVGALVRGGRYAEALQLLEPMFAQGAGLAQGDDVRLHAMLAQCYLATRRPADALRVATEAVALQPDHFGSNVAYAKIALSLAGRGAEPSVHLERAVERIDHAIALRPGDGAAHATRAEVLFALDRREEAMEAWRAAWRLDARDPSPLVRLGYVQLDRGQWEAARATFEEILGAFQDDALPFIGRARAEMELGELEAAERSLAQAALAPVPNPAVLDATRARLVELRGEKP